MGLGGGIQVMPPLTPNNEAEFWKQFGKLCANSESTRADLIQLKKDFGKLSEKVGKLERGKSDGGSSSDPGQSGPHDLAVLELRMVEKQKADRRFWITIAVSLLAVAGAFWGGHAHGAAHDLHTEVHGQ